MHNLRPDASVNGADSVKDRCQLKCDEDAECSAYDFDLTRDFCRTWKSCPSCSLKGPARLSGPHQHACPWNIYEKIGAIHEDCDVVLHIPDRSLLKPLSNMLRTTTTGGFSIVLESGSEQGHRTHLRALGLLLPCALLMLHFIDSIRD